MQLDDWKSIQHFKPNEKTPWGSPNAFGDPLKMNLALMMLVDRFRDDTGFTLHIHCGYDLSGHATHSLHPEGKAIDGSCPALDPWLLFKEAVKYPFTQIGVYECWNNPGLHLGLHGQGWTEPKCLWWTEVVGYRKPVYKYHYF